MSPEVVWNLAFQVQPAPGDPFTGRLFNEDGSSYEFTGWLSFAAAVEQARRERSPSTGGSSPDPPAR
jgi:hypothetical protein